MKNGVMWIVGFMLFSTLSWSNVSTSWEEATGKSDNDIVRFFYNSIESLEVSEKQELMRLIDSEKGKAKKMADNFEERKNNLSFALSSKRQSLNTCVNEQNSMKKEIMEQNGEQASIAIKIPEQFENIKNYNAAIEEAKKDLEQKLKKESFQIVILSKVPYDRKDRINDVINGAQKSASEFGIKKMNGAQLVSQTLIENQLQVNEIIKIQESGVAKSASSKEFKKIAGKQRFLYLISKFNIFPLEENVNALSGLGSVDKWKNNTKNIRVKEQAALDEIGEVDVSLKSYAIELVEDAKVANQKTKNRIKKHLSDYSFVLNSNKRKIKQTEQKLKRLKADSSDVVQLIQNLEFEKERLDQRCEMSRADYDKTQATYFAHLKDEEYMMVISIPKFAPGNKSEDEVYKEIASETVSNFTTKIKENSSSRKSVVQNGALVQDEKSESQGKANVTEVRLLGFYGEQDGARIQYELAVAFKYRFDEKKENLKKQVEKSQFDFEKLLAQPKVITPRSISINTPDQLELIVGQLRDLKVDVQPRGASQDVTWVISDENILAMVKSSTLRALSEGTTRVTVFSKLDPKVKQVVQVKVVDPKRKEKLSVAKSPLEEELSLVETQAKNQARTQAKVQEAAKSVSPKDESFRWGKWTMVGITAIGGVFFLNEFNQLNDRIKAQQAANWAGENVDHCEDPDTCSKEEGAAFNNLLFGSALLGTSLGLSIWF